MSFPTAVKTCLSKYATFTGRARRSEYWWWTLFYGLVYLVLYIPGLILTLTGTALLDESGGTSAGGTAAVVLGGILLLLLVIMALGLFLPALAVTVRRLHDTGRSGWWYLISLVPFGGLVLLVFEVMDSTPGPNEHGPNPKGVEAAYPDPYAPHPYAPAPYAQAPYAPGPNAQAPYTPAPPSPGQYGPPRNDPDPYARGQ